MSSIHGDVAAGALVNFLWSFTSLQLNLDCYRTTKCLAWHLYVRVLVCRTARLFRPVELDPINSFIGVVISSCNLRNEKPSDLARRRLGWPHTEAVSNRHLGQLELEQWVGYGTPDMRALNRMTVRRSRLKSVPGYCTIYAWPRLLETCASATSICGWHGDRQKAVSVIKSFPRNFDWTPRASYLEAVYLVLVILVQSSRSRSSKKGHQKRTSWCRFCGTSPARGRDPARHPVRCRSRSGVALGFGDIAMLAAYQESDECASHTVKATTKIDPAGNGSLNSVVSNVLKSTAGKYCCWTDVGESCKRSGEDMVVVHRVNTDDDVCSDTSCVLPTKLRASVHLVVIRQLCSL
jgi:hypothetical protein